MKTQTLGADDPVISILEGHHDLETFNRAWAAEGWDGPGFDAELVAHEFWTKDDKGHWSPSVKTDPKAIPVTVGDW